MLTLPALVHFRVGAHDVVVGEDVSEPEFFDALSIRTYDCGVSTKLGLREHDTNAHSPFNRAVPQLLPRSRLCPSLAAEGAAMGVLESLRSSVTKLLCLDVFHRANGL
jgi:hypothetical protein